MKTSDSQADLMLVALSLENSLDVTQKPRQSQRKEQIEVCLCVYLLILFFSLMILFPGFNLYDHTSHWYHITVRLINAWLISDALEGENSGPLPTMVAWSSLSEDASPLSAHTSGAIMMGIT